MKNEINLALIFKCRVSDNFKPKVYISKNEIKRRMFINKISARV